MSKEQDLLDLEAVDSDLRLRAARSLTVKGNFEDVEVLRTSLRTESVPWVRAALLEAIEVLVADAAPGPAGPPFDPPGRSSESLYLDGLQLTTERVVHELRTVAGALRYWAKKEYGGYTGSKTEGQVERLRRCLDAIKTLGNTTDVATLAEVELASLVRDEVDVVESCGDLVQEIGPSPFMVLADKGALSLILRNALANATEAGSDVRVTWGSGSDDTWIAVLNRGSGLPVDVEPLFDFGTSTKGETHVGAGLAIVSHYALRLQGDVFLTDEADGSVKLEFRWPGIVRAD